MSITYGTSGDDSYQLTTATAIKTGEGNDRVIGSSGADSINGGEGDDKINGGAGNDVITGGTGHDQVVGGSGNDTFVFYAGDLVNRFDSGGQMDQIIDFKGAGGYTTGENDFIGFFGFVEGSHMEFDKYLANNTSWQIYAVYNGEGTDDLAGHILIQGGTAMLVEGDYRFF